MLTFLKIKIDRIKMMIRSKIGQLLLSLYSSVSRNFEFQKFCDSKYQILNSELSNWLLASYFQ